MSDLLLYLHVLGAMVLMGTGIGIAFFMAVANLGGDPARIAPVAAIVVLADTVFTAPAALLQPVTGTLLALDRGWPLTEPWLLAAVALYLVVGAFWLPVVWMQIRLRDMARAALAEGLPLPPAYRRLYRLWFASGIPAFAAMLAIIALMLTRPALL